MKLFLAGVESFYSSFFPNLTKKMREVEDEICTLNQIFMLESFFYVNKYSEIINPHLGDYLLDSGAFTFLRSANKKEIDWDDYLLRYSQFINRLCVKRFFELDIDSIVGYSKVLDFRKKLEDLTGRKCIPVWHKSRGKEEFLRMCEDYDYVALGGIAIKEIPKSQYHFFPWLINEAHKSGAKIHGLGFTRFPLLKFYRFDSVDSSSWVYGNKGGMLFKFNGAEIKRFLAPKGFRLTKESRLHNFKEWLKASQWVRANL